MPALAIKPKLGLQEFKRMNDEVMRYRRAVTDAFSNPSARLGFGQPHMLEGTSYPLTRLTYNYILLTSLYRSNWIVRKVVDAKAEDMVKNWLTFTSQQPPKKLDKLNKAIDSTGTVAKLIESLKWARLYGGAGALMVIDGHDDLTQPLDLDDVEIGAFKGLLVFDRWAGIYPGARLASDINDVKSFGLPESYQITSDAPTKTVSVHHSRILRFCGRMLPRWEFQANQYWGISEVEIMFDELKKRDNTSWNIASLVFRANILAMKQKDLNQMLSGIAAPGKAQMNFYNVMQAINELMSNQGLMVLPEDGGLDQHTYSFAGISDVYQNFMLDICGATEYPMSILFGRTITGLGQGNEGDEHNYYNGISQKQKQELDPELKQLLPVVAMSTWGEVPDEFTWKFNPVYSLSDKDRADLAKTNTEAIGSMYDSGIVGRKTSLQELQQQADVTGLFSNISDEEVEEADNEVVGKAEEMEFEQEQGEADRDHASELADKKADSEKQQPAPGKKKAAAQDGSVREIMTSGSNALGRIAARYRKQAEKAGKHALAASGLDCDEEQKLTHEEVKYQAQAKKSDRCMGCARFQSPGMCQIVQAPISPRGWCTEFKAAPAKTEALDHEIEFEQLDFQGLSIDIEQLRGSVRHGSSFHQKMTVPYGYIRKTEGADGDAVDCFIGPVADAEHVYVIHNGEPDAEDKVMLGFANAKDAYETYMENYDDMGAKLFDGMEKFTMPEFKRKLKELHGKKITSETSAAA